LNYARIYGAGIKFVERFLLQNDHNLTEREAQEKARAIFKSTKGQRKVVKGERQWKGGTESHMFNVLERIASSPEPETPFLRAKLSKALVPSNDPSRKYDTSRINWVVQSSAVDFLHLLIVSMKWLMDEYQIQGRFSISIHDEVRYLVKSEDRYRASFALHLCNLYVRAFFAHRVGINDLPLSVGFFSSVEIDKVLRKDPQHDQITLSNPHGLAQGYGIPPGESVDIQTLLKKKVKL